MLTTGRILGGLPGPSILVAATLLLVTPRPAAAQLDPNLLHACYVPDVGAVYRIGTADTPAGCFETTHVQFSWDPMDLGCDTDEVAKWNGTGWSCGTDEIGAPTDHTHTGLILAAAWVDGDASLGAHTSNVTAVSYNESLNRYEITIAGENYYFSDYVTVVQGTNAPQLTPLVSSVGGKLLISLYNQATGIPQRHEFQFVTYKP